MTSRADAGPPEAHRLDNDSKWSLEPLLRHAERSHRRLPGIRKIPLRAVGIILLIAFLNIIVWIAAAIVLVSSQLPTSLSQAPMLTRDSVITRTFLRPTMTHDRTHNQLKRFKMLTWHPKVSGIYRRAGLFSRSETCLRCRSHFRMLQRQSVKVAANPVSRQLTS